MKIDRKEKELLYSSVSFACNSVDSSDGDYWDEATCFTGTVAMGLGFVGTIAAFTGPVGAPIAFGAGVAGTALGAVSAGLSVADTASK